MTGAGAVIGNALLLVVALGAAAGTVCWSVAGRRPGALRAARGLTVGAALAAVAAVALLQVFLIGAGPLPFAQRVTSQAMPVYYRVSGMWSALEGSLLLWLVIVAVVAAYGTREAVRPGGHLAAATLAGVVAASAGVSLMASPFADAAGGAAPSPLLQDHVAMGVHPPLLYLGFALTVVPYAWAVAGGLTRLDPAVVDGAWMARVRRWSLISWVFLTAGIALGAWWSYAVLGWGGYWAWDPVENASVLPWLAVTALIHVLLIGSGVRGRGLIALTGAGFVLVVLAQFLTRSGAVQSIHAFSDSPFGPVLAVLTVLAALVVLAPLVRVPASPPPLGPRGRALTLQAVLMVVLAVIVAVGTVLPTILAVTTGRLVSVGPPWYERTLAPVAVATLVLLAVGPWLPARGAGLRSTAATTVRRMRVPLLVAGVTIGVVALLTRDVVIALSAALLAHILTGVILGVVRGKGSGGARRRVGAGLAHAGIALAALSIVAGAHEVVREATLPIGGTVSAGSTSATLVGFDRFEDGPRILARAELVLGRDGQHLATARPQLRWYEEQGAMLSGPAIRTGAADDVYVTLLDIDPATSTATVRLAVTPLMSWLWAAAGVLVIGGGIAALPRRRAAPTAEPDRSPGEVVIAG